MASEEKHTRRQLLTIGISLSLAGCMGNRSTNNRSNPGTNNTTKTTGSATESSSVFKKIGFEGTTLVVELENNVSVDIVRVVDSNGEKVGEFKFGEGVSRASTKHGSTLNTKWDFVAVRDGERVATVTKTFEPNLKVAGIARPADSEGLSLDTTSKTPEGQSDLLEGVDGALKDELVGEEDQKRREKFTSAVVTFENTGNAPFALSIKPYLVKGTPQYVKPSEVDKPRTVDSAITIPPKSSKQVRTVTSEVFLIRVAHDAMDNIYELTTGYRGYESFGDEEALNPKSRCTGETYDSKLVYFDDNGERYEKPVSITYSGGLYRIMSYSPRRDYVCGNVKINTKSS